MYDDAKQLGIELTGFDLDQRRHATGTPLLAANEIAQNVFNNHGETCETFKTATKFMEQWQPVFDKYIETEEGEGELMDIENKFITDLLECYSLLLQNEFEYLQSEDSIIETIEINEYDFTEDGKLY